MAKSLLYRPQKTADAFSADFGKETSDFARHFQLLADLIDKSESDSEAFALYISTCRNAYLTINGMFYDIREIFGKISPARGLFGTLQLAQGGAFDAMTITLDEVRMALVAFEEKRVCWSRREELGKKLKFLLSQYSYLDKKALEDILHEVVSQDDLCNQASVRQFFAFDSTEHDEQHSLIQKLTDTEEKLHKVLECATRIRELGDECKKAILSQSSNVYQTVLFEKFSSLAALKKRGSELNIWLDSAAGNSAMDLISQALANGEKQALATSNLNYYGREVLIQCEDTEKVSGILVQLSEQLQYAVDGAYKSVCTLFRPNIGITPMPSPFLIDLSVPTSAKPDGKKAVVTNPLSFSKPSPEKIVIAVANPPIGAAEISEANARYKSDEKRRIAKEWSCLAIQTAAADAQLIIFPELFIPEEAVGAVHEVANNSGIGVVCGIEGIWNVRNTYSCQASILIPGANQPYRQLKNYRSNYESGNFETKGGQCCFLQSSLGSFSVILCSDFREFDVVAAIEAQPFLDYLIICSCNPYPELWKHMAIADAARLNCFVVISNWSMDRDQNGHGFSSGSICAAPMRKIESEPCLEPRVSKLSLPDHNNEINGSISFYELDLAALFRDREKPQKNFLAPPRRRLSINK